MLAYTHKFVGETNHVAHTNMSRLNEKLQIVVVKWFDVDGIAEPIGKELIALGHEVKYIDRNEDIPDEVDVVFSFAPYGRFYPIHSRLSKIPESKRPVFIHWNFESFPNHKIPWKIIQIISSFRSWIDRLNESESRLARYLVGKPPLAVVNQYMHKFRYIGEYQFAYKMGQLNMLFETSDIHAKLYNQNGFPAIYVPWGTSPCWYSELNLKRDIDVLWMGKRRTKRRRRIIDRIYNELQSRGFNMHIADGEVNPFIFDDVRIRFLNRAKITLGISPSWYDTSYVFRVNLAAANRSLFISEKVLPHSPKFVPNVHYVSVPIEQIIESLVYYLNHEAERKGMIDSAYQLVTTDLTLHNSIKTIMKNLYVQQSKM